jgi:hypothetical protein
MTVSARFADLRQMTFSEAEVRCRKRLSQRAGESDAAPRGASDK